MNRFLGIWIGPDEYTTEVEYSVTELSGRVVVDARDPSDGERAEVSDVSVLTTGCSSQPVGLPQGAVPYASSRWSRATKSNSPSLIMRA